MLKEKLNNFKVKISYVFELFGKYYKVIRDFCSPKGSYILATLPFYFLYQFAITYIRINEKIIITFFIVIAAFLNTFHTKLAMLPIAIVFFFALWDKSIFLAIASVIIIIISSGYLKYVKKGKFQYPLLIMIMTGCLMKSPLFFIIALMFMCSLFWGDFMNILIAPLAVVFNFLAFSTIVDLSCYVEEGASSWKCFPIDQYINSMILEFKTYPDYIGRLSPLVDNLMFYIVVFVGLIFSAYLFGQIVLRTKIFRFQLLYICISHLYLGVVLLLIILLGYYVNVFNSYVNLNKTAGIEVNVLNSFDNFISFLPILKNMVHDSVEGTFGIKEVLYAFILTIPISIFVNGYESQKTMVSKGIKVNNKVTGIEVGSIENENDKILWNDIAGYESVKREIQDFIAPYTDPLIKNKLKNANMDMPKGILLFGPPGCGKTMFAKAIASNSGMSFISVKGNEFTSKWVGESEKNLREIFESARTKAPCIIFFDELEAFLQKREEVNEHNKSLVTTFLTEMDGFANDDRFFVVGATNNPDMLDSASIRPGRFDKCIYIDTPDSKAREAILKKYLKGKGNFTDEEMNNLIDMTRRYSGADIRSFIEETFKAQRFNSINFVMLKNMLSHYKPTMDYEMQKKFTKLQAKYNRSTYSQNDVAINNHPKVTWADAPGMEYIKEQIKELIEKPLKYAKKYKEMGIKYSKGVLMYGPPGCGKTLVSKIIASEYDLYFLPVNGPELLSGITGKSEEQIRRIFMEAKDNAPSVIFFDEFDSIAEHREMQIGQTKIINQLLTEIDGNEELEGVIVIGATNRIEVIDTALRRPGRFDKILYVGMPNEESREAQFKLYLGKLNGEHEYKKFAIAADKFTCADISACCKKIMLKALDLSIANDNYELGDDEIIKTIKEFNRSLSDDEILKYEETAKFERK